MITFQSHSCQNLEEKISQINIKFIEKQADQWEYIQLWEISLKWSRTRTHVLSRTLKDEVWLFSLMKSFF